jgi:hypothetical protein
MADVCPGCGVQFAPFSGPTHRYVGATPACWALYTAVLVNGEPDPALLEDSLVPEHSTAPTRTAPDDLGQLIADAYAAQHHGVPGPMSTQSVAVHLLTLHGVLRRDVAVENALWPRRRSLRDKGVYTWLEPPPLGAALSVRHFFPGGGVREPVTRADYVTSVYETWDAAHGPRLAEWYDRYVLAD